MIRIWPGLLDHEEAAAAVAGVGDEDRRAEPGLDDVEIDGGPSAGLNAAATGAPTTRWSDRPSQCLEPPPSIDSTRTAGGAAALDRLGRPPGPNRPSPTTANGGTDRRPAAPARRCGARDRGGGRFETVCTVRLLQAACAGRVRAFDRTRRRSRQRAHRPTVAAVRWPGTAPGCAAGRVLGWPRRAPLDARCEPAAPPARRRPTRRTGVADRPSPEDPWQSAPTTPATRPRGRFRPAERLGRRTARSSATSTCRPTSARRPS